MCVRDAFHLIFGFVERCACDAERVGELWVEKIYIETKPQIQSRDNPSSGNLERRSSQMVRCARVVGDHVSFWAKFYLLLFSCNWVSKNSVKRGFCFGIYVRDIMWGGGEASEAANG